MNKETDRVEVRNRFAEGDKVYLLNSNTNKVDCKEVKGVRIDSIFERINIYYLLEKDKDVIEEKIMPSLMQKHFWISQDNIYASKDELRIGLNL